MLGNNKSKNPLQNFWDEICSLELKLSVCAVQPPPLKWLRSNKTIPPAKTYCNNLDPGDIPPEIQALSQAEHLLLTRIHPFLKIIKFSRLCGQYGFKG